jgi:hypothetical protein
LCLKLGAAELESGHGAHLFVGARASGGEVLDVISLGERAFEADVVDNPPPVVEAHETTVRSQQATQSTALLQQVAKPPRAPIEVSRLHLHEANLVDALDQNVLEMLEHDRDHTLLEVASQTKAKRDLGLIAKASESVRARIIRRPYLRRRHHHPSPLDKRTCVFRFFMSAAVIGRILGEETVFLQSQGVYLHRWSSGAVSQSRETRPESPLRDRVHPLLTGT